MRYILKCRTKDKPCLLSDCGTIVFGASINKRDGGGYSLLDELGHLKMHWIEHQPIPYKNVRLYKKMCK